MAISFPDNINLGVGNPIDAKYLNSSNAPYVSLAAVKSAIVLSQRYVGLTVLVVTGGTNSEYWFKQGVTDGDLVLKTAPTTGSTGTITGATNGLSVTGKKIKLGGSLTGDTSIDLCGHIFDVIGAPATHFMYLDDTNNSACFGTTGAASVTTLRNVDSQLTFNGTSAVFQGTSGMTYAGDYSGSFIDRSLPDVAYVNSKISPFTGITVTALTGATNGLCASGQNALLGGALCETTTICGAAQKLCIGTAASRLTCLITNTDTCICLESNNGSCDSNLFVSPGGAQVYQAGTSRNGMLDINNGIVSLQSADVTCTCLFMNENDICITGTNPAFPGIQYATDYSANYNARSIPDVGYVNQIGSGLFPKQAVRVATTGNTVLSGLTIIDGIQLLANDRVLVKDQTTGSTNGIYNASTGVWTRATDMDFSPSGETVSGSYSWVLTGVTNGHTAWVLTTPDPISSGDTLTFVLFNQTSDVTAGVGIVVTTSGTTNIVSLDSEAQKVRLNAITGATNGLCKYNAHNVCLGGALVANTSISGANTYCLCLGTCPSRLECLGGFACSQVCLEASNGICKGNLFLYPIQAQMGSTCDNRTGYIDTNAGAISLSSCSGSSCTYFIMSHECVIADSSFTNFKGIEYFSDHSANYSLRSLVDKEYVDNAIGGTITGATNGLSVYGKNIGLGGTITGDTTITSDKRLLLVSSASTSIFDLRFDTKVIETRVISDDSTFLSSIDVWLPSENSPQVNIAARCETSYGSEAVLTAGSIELKYQESGNTQRVFSINNNCFTFCGLSPKTTETCGIYVDASGNISYGVVSSGGSTVLSNGILQWSGDTFNPYSNATAGKFYSGTTKPTSRTTNLKYNGNFNSTNLFASGGTTQLGNCAGFNSSCTVCQTVIGSCTGINNSAMCQTAIGFCAGVNNSGSVQIAIGGLAGCGNTGNVQLAIGNGAGYGNTGACQIAIGVNAGQTNKSTNQYVFGTDAGNGNKLNSPFQLALGHQAGMNNSGCTQVAIGYQAGANNNSCCQVAIGYQAGCGNSGSTQVAVGCLTGCANRGVCQVAIGLSAGIANRGAHQVAIGSYAGFCNLPDNQIAIGCLAGYCNKCYQQVAIGNRAGVCNFGTYQTAIGFCTGLLNSGGTQVAIGQNVGQCNKCNQLVIGSGSAGFLNKGNYQIAIGDSTALFNSGDTQTAIGKNAGCSNKGCSQVAIGENAGYLNCCNNQIAIGCYAGQSNKGINQTAVGCQAGYLNTGANQLALGGAAGYTNIGAQQIALGCFSGYGNSGTTQVAIGFCAGCCNKCAREVAIGNGAGSGNFGNDQIAIGSFAGCLNQGSNQIAIGCLSASFNSGSTQIAIGISAGSFNKCNDQIAIGAAAGYCNKGIYQVAIGNNAGRDACNNSCQVAIGLRAGYRSSGSTQVAIGNSAGECANGCCQVAIGDFAGCLNSGTTQIAIGYQAGMSNKCDNLIAIGYQAGCNNTVANSFILKQANVSAIPLICGSFSTGDVYMRCLTLSSLSGATGGQVGVNAAGKLTRGVTGGTLIKTVCNLTTPTYNIKQSDFYIGTSGGSTVTLLPNPNGAAINGMVVTVADVAGNASPACYVQISGAFFGGSIVACIDTAYGAISFLYNGGKSCWGAIAFSQSLVV